MGWMSGSGYSHGERIGRKMVDVRRITWARIRSRLSRFRASLRARARHAVLVVNPSAFSGSTNSPADFTRWVERGMGSRSSGFPDIWRTKFDLPTTPTARVCVILHVYYAEVLSEILEHLACIPVPFDLVVTNASNAAIAIDTTGLGQAKTVRILGVDNHGRDILPLVQVVNAGLVDGYQLVLKVHTKKSQWRAAHELGGTGAEWRNGLLSSLLGSTDNVTAILNGFAASPNLGIVTADGSVLGTEFWGDNQDVTAALLRRLELDRPESIRFAAGSMYWVRGFVLQGLRALNLSATDFEPEAGQVNATTAHAVERLIGIVAEEAGLAIVERRELRNGVDARGWRRYAPDSSLRRRLRLVPFYLPQFHPIPENDRWWGPGFTEWTNVTSARPAYHGHDQPKLPGELGFYDLRIPGIVTRQAELAEAAGIEAFMYYYYWFAGHQLLEKPINDRLRSDVGMRFCLMWANENWTRRWDGRESDILMGQSYEAVPAGQFIRDVMPIIADPRYMRIDGRAVLAIYRPGQIPDLGTVVAAWRDAARDAGVGELCLLNVDVAREFHGLEDDPQSGGLDGTLGFPPHNALWDWVSHQHVQAPPRFEGNVLSYRSMANDAIRKLSAGVADHYYPGVMVAFDNTARRQNDPDIWFGANPYTFRRWLSAAASAVTHRAPEHRIVFVNAWNEWAEGAILEPTARFGGTYLAAIRDVALG